LGAGLIEEGLIKKVIASMECRACRQFYNADNIDVIGHEGELWFLRAFCSTCRVQHLIAVVIKEDRAPVVITDLTEAELDKFRNVGVLTADEMLDIHNFLKDFEGDFSQLFSQG